jgi:hypothetical protein
MKKHLMPKLPHPADAYLGELVYFTPAGAEQITGLSTAMQRDWRKRAYLPHGDGHARFTIIDLCRLFLLKRLSDRGIGPDKASAVVDSAAHDLVIEVLNSIEVWNFSNPISNWSVIRSELTRRVLEAHSKDASCVGSGFNRPKFIWWADDTCLLCDSFDEELNGIISGDPRICGPIIILDLFALSGVIIDRMPTAFATAKLTNEEGQQTKFQRRETVGYLSAGAKSPRQKER